MVEEMPLIRMLAAEAPNLTAWALLPLEETVPEDLRQKVTYLREDLIDEGKSRPAADLDAYRAGVALCESLLTAMNVRESARVTAGYGAALSVAQQKNTSQALEARRNYMMSWPQHAREGDQRAELQRQSAARSAAAGEAQKVAWTARADGLRRNLDDLYRQLRAAMRKG